MHACIIAALRFLIISYRKCRAWSIRPSQDINSLPSSSRHPETERSEERGQHTSDRISHNHEPVPDFTGAWIISRTRMCMTRSVPIETWFFSLPFSCCFKSSNCISPLVELEFRNTRSGFSREGPDKEKTHLDQLSYPRNVVSIKRKMLYIHATANGNFPAWLLGVRCWACTVVTIVYICANYAWNPSEWPRTSLKRQNTRITVRMQFRIFKNRRAIVLDNKIIILKELKKKKFSQMSFAASNFCKKQTKTKKQTNNQTNKQKN